jgi:hypothetical protein
MKRAALVIAALRVRSTVAKCENSTQVALKLGTIVGSKKACQLRLGQNAIKQVIKSA